MHSLWVWVRCLYKPTSVLLSSTALHPKQSQFRSFGFYQELFFLVFLFVLALKNGAFWFNTRAY